MKEHQKIRIFATVSKVSDIENEWWSMEKKVNKVNIQFHPYTIFKCLNVVWMSIFN